MFAGGLGETSNNRLVIVWKNSHKVHEKVSSEALLKDGEGVFEEGSLNLVMMGYRLCCYATLLQVDMFDAQCWYILIFLPPVAPAPLLQFGIPKGENLCANWLEFSGRFFPLS